MLLQLHVQMLLQLHAASAQHVPTLTLPNDPMPRVLPSL
jgi:hypothetical protein